MYKFSIAEEIVTEVNHHQSISLTLSFHQEAAFPPSPPTPLSKTPAPSLPSETSLKMAWVRPKHPKPKPDVDPTETLRPVLEYFSCSSRTNNAPSNPISKAALSRMPPPPKKSLLLLPQDAFEPPRPRKRQHDEETERSRSPDQHRRREEQHHRAESHHRAEHHHPRADHDTVEDDDDGVDYYERASQRSTSNYTREVSPPPPRSPPLSSYRSSARPGAHLRLRPSRHHIAADIYASRRPVSRWASATTPLEM